MPVEIETWIDNSSNQQQQYLTHGAFRYFGKLPPTVTGRILDELDVRPDHAVVDVMCGSGPEPVRPPGDGAADRPRQVPVAGIFRSTSTLDWCWLTIERCSPLECSICGGRSASRAAWTFPPSTPSWPWLRTP